MKKGNLGKLDRPPRSNDSQGAEEMILGIRSILQTISKEGIDPQQKRILHELVSGENRKLELNLSTLQKKGVSQGEVNQINANFAKYSNPEEYVSALVIDKFGSDEKLMHLILDKLKSLETPQGSKQKMLAAASDPAVVQLMSKSKRSKPDANDPIKDERGPSSGKQ